MLITYTFGSFYGAIFGMALIFLIILMMGGVSIFTAMWFCATFLFVMFLGNGVWLIVLPISIVIILAFIKGLTIYIESTAWLGNR